MDFSNSLARNHSIWEVLEALVLEDEEAILTLKTELEGMRERQRRIDEIKDPDTARALKNKNLGDVS